MSTIGNILWFLFGGLIGGLAWVLAGCLWCITIIGIPVGLQCFKFASLAFFPFGKEVVYGGGGFLEMSRKVQSGNTQNLKSSAAPVRLPAAPASTPGTSQAATQAGCVYRP